MTALTSDQHVTSATGPSPSAATQAGRSLTAEWTKLRSVSSTMISLLATVVVCVGLAAALSAATINRWSHFSPARQAAFQPATFSLSGLFLGQLIIGVLGVLVMSAEYSSGTIRATVAAVPARPLVLWTKTAVFALTSFVVSLVTCFASFWLAQSILSGTTPTASLSQPGVLRVVIGGALYMTCIGLFGLGLATILRHTAGAISTLFGLLFVLPIIGAFLPSSLANDVTKYFPSAAGTEIVQLNATGPGDLAPWAGFAVLCGYVLIALVVGGVLLSRRDA
jgi:ABC-2 type transport system permease protein